MRWWNFFLALTIATSAAHAADLLPIEQQVAAVTKGEKVTVVHFWAPWCSNCYGEISKKDGWASFINANKDVNVIFVTSWNGGQGDGRSLLQKHGIGAQPNFQLLLHPNGARNDAERMRTFLGYEMNWIPATWIFREGKLRYALNYGEVRFAILQQLVKDAQDKWE
jgi:thiol-disulfide isomerase/thioredoxin